MNSKSQFLILIVCGLMLSALVIRNGEILLLAIPFLCYLIIGVIQAPGKISLLADRTLDKQSVSVQEQVEVRIVIRNQGNALVNLSLDDALSPSVEILEGKESQRLYLSAGESTEVNYRFKAARGIYTWNAVRACASDPFGLVAIECNVPACGEVLVRPATMQIRPIILKPQRTLHASGAISARLAGSGTDFWGVREYRPGDSLRRLNYRLAARYPGELFTNEYEREEIGDFGLILDARKLTTADRLEETLFEYSVCAAATLSEDFLKNGNRVSLLVFGESITSVFPGYGKRQSYLLQRKLAHARLGANILFRYLEYFPARLFPARSQIIIFSTVDPRDLETYARLIAFGYDVLLISPDPIDCVSRTLPRTDVNTLAVRAARVERVVQLRRLARLGVNVIDWQVNQPLETNFRRNGRNVTRGRYS